MSRDQRKYKEADKQRRAGEREKRRLEKAKAMEDFKNGPIVLGDDAAARLRDVLAETPTDSKEEE